MPKKILVGILDWGLGHATRCVPLISYLLQTQCQILIAASGAQKKVLSEAFPELIFLDPPPYSIEYPPGGRNLIFSIMKQLPRLKRVINNEHNWVRKMVYKHKIDLVISDNRYGFYSSYVPSVIITHQLAPRSGLGPWVDAVVRRIHFRYLAPFKERWVPDVADSSSLLHSGLAGSLSHPPRLPLNTHYIGPLSRFSRASLEGPDLGSQVLVLISGPEPARTEFETLIRKQVGSAGVKYTLVRGLPGEEQHSENEFNHAGRELMGQLLKRASLVICRSGYSTIMDLVCLGKKAVLVPTPGQTEQEYLAEHLHQQKLFPYLSQATFDLKKAMAMARNFEYGNVDLDYDQYKNTLDRFIQ